MKKNKDALAAILGIFIFSWSLWAQRDITPGISSTARLQLAISKDIPIKLTTKQKNNPRIGVVTVSLQEGRILHFNTAEHPGSIFFAVLATDSRNPSDNPVWIHYGTWIVGKEQINKPATYTINQLRRAKNGSFLWIWIATPLQMTEFYEP